MKLRPLEWMHSDLAEQVFIKDFKSYSKEDALNFIENANKNNTDIHYACVDDEDNYLGTVSLKNIDRTNQNAEFAISFIEKAHGTGASSFATIELLKKAFYELKLEKVYLNVLDLNQRAIAFYEKMGFIKEGHFQKHVLKKGCYHDLLWYRMTSDEFKMQYLKKMERI